MGADFGWSSKKNHNQKCVKNKQKSEKL